MKRFLFLVIALVAMQTLCAQTFTFQSAGVGVSNYNGCGPTASQPNGCVFTVDSPQEDQTGYWMWVGHVGPADGSGFNGHPELQMRRDGGTRFWDYLHVWPYSAGPPYWNWTGTLDNGLLTLGSDIPNPDASSIVVYAADQNRYQMNHELLRFYNNVSIDQNGDIRGKTLALDIDGQARVKLGSITYANLSACSAHNPCAGGATSGQPPDGTIVYCGDCQPVTPCTANGTGALARLVNGVWACSDAPSAGPRLKSYTVATLPACNKDTAGTFVSVTDSVASPTYNTITSGGGSTVIPVFCDGANWTNH